METAELTIEGNHQVVRLPRGYHLSGDEVIVKRLGNAIILLPKEDPWQVMFDALEDISTDLHIECQQPRLRDRKPIE